MKHKKHDNHKKRKGSSNNPLKPQQHGHKSKVAKPAHSAKNKNFGNQSALNAKPIVPFKPTDSILLIGEGDFSFTKAIIDNGLISPSTILTTSTNESEASMYEKYPQTKEIIENIRSGGKESDSKVEEDNDEDDVDFENDRDSPVDDDEISSAKPSSNTRRAGHRVFFNVDVTKKYPKGIKKHKYDAIIFNFPHTGGLTADVDRQIRANQQLILSFLSASVPLLTPTGCIVITLFDGEPYTRWNVKELAKSVGLKSRLSFRFDAKLYEGYKHVRTIGNRDREGDWKGEERSARTWVFESTTGVKGPKKDKIRPKQGKSRRDEDSSDDDD